MKKLIQKISTVIVVTLGLAVAPLALSTISPPPTLAHHCFGHGSGSGETASGDIRECMDAGACIDTAGQGGNCPNPDTLDADVNAIIRLVINILSFIVGIVAVIMIIIGGLKYITSAGDPNNVSSAKNTILYAIIGLVVVALAQIIVRFVLSKV